MHEMNTAFGLIVPVRSARAGRPETTSPAPAALVVMGPDQLRIGGRPTGAPDPRKAASTGALNALLLAFEQGTPEIEAIDLSWLEDDMGWTPEGWTCDHHAPGLQPAEVATPAPAVPVATMQVDNYPVAAAAPAGGGIDAGVVSTGGARFTPEEWTVMTPLQRYQALVDTPEGQRCLALPGGSDALARQVGFVAAAPAAGYIIDWDRTRQFWGGVTDVTLDVASAVNPAVGLPFRLGWEGLKRLFGHETA